jgi:predicted transcriptional regulator
MNANEYYCREREAPVAKTVTVRIDDSTYRRIKSAADAERRTISNFIEYATMTYVENSSFVDNDEMRGISEDKELVTTLNRAMEDIKRGKYRIVR